MKFEIGNEIKIIEPTPEVMTYVKENLVLENPEFHKKQRMGFYTGNIPSKLYLYTRDGDTINVPYGCLKDIWPLKGKNDPVETFFKEVEPIDYGKPVPLYDYQQKAAETIKAKQYGMLQSPAGSGKTQIGIALIKMFGVKTLWLTHTLDLLNQSKERALRYMDKDLIGTIASGKVNIGKGVTFATVQTMCNLDLTKYKDTWDLIIVDEAHRVAGTPNQVTMFYKVLSNLRARHKYGLSATVYRADGMIKATYAVLGKVAYEVPPEEVKDKICEVGVVPIYTKTTLTEDCKNTDGTINYTNYITHITNDDERNLLIIKQVIKNKNHSCLILSERLDHLKKLRELLPLDMLISSELISGKMTNKKDKEYRSKVLEKMRTGELQYLFATYNLCGEGLDIQRLDRAFFTTPIHDYTRVTQAIGRVARKIEGKYQPLVYDFIDYSTYAFRLFSKRKTTYHKNKAFLTTDEGLL